MVRWIALARASAKRNPANSPRTVLCSTSVCALAEQKMRCHSFALLLSTGLPLADKPAEQERFRPFRLTPARRSAVRRGYRIACTALCKESRCNARCDPGSGVRSPLPAQLCSRADRQERLPFREKPPDREPLAGGCQPRSSRAAKHLRTSRPSAVVCCSCGLPFAWEVSAGKGKPLQQAPGSGTEQPRFSRGTIQAPADRLGVPGFVCLEAFAAFAVVVFLFRLPEGML